VLNTHTKDTCRKREGVIVRERVREKEGEREGLDLPLAQ
jgi:hypothetical protein